MRDMFGRHVPPTRSADTMLPILLFTFSLCHQLSGCPTAGARGTAVKGRDG